MKQYAGILLVTIMVIINYPVAGQPAASFTVDRYNVCSGTSVALTNTSTGANHYEWFTEGLHHSFAFHTTMTLVESCYDLKELKLVVTDTVTGIADSASKVVEVFDTCSFHLTGDFLKCPGDTVVMSVNSEEIATLFTITPPHTLFAGCLTCPSISFVLQSSGTNVDRKSTYFGGCSEITSYHYSCWSGVGEPEALLQVQFFPHPAHDELIIEFPTFINRMSIFNIEGRLIWKAHSLMPGSNKVDVSHFPPGIYFLSIITKQGQVVGGKFIKQ